MLTRLRTCYAAAWRSASQSWLAALPILLIMAALALRQIDIYPASVDEFFSLFNAGWLSESAYSPEDVMRSLRRYSPDHTPLYFLALNLWGHLVGHALALSRVLSVLCSLMALALVFRLARDFIAKSAGILVLVILSSNAFFNFYIANARMYPLMLLLSGAVLWLYLRLIRPAGRSRRLDYLAFAAALFCLISAHVFSLIFLAALAAYHLIFIRKDRAWLWLSLCLMVAGALNSPWLLRMLGDLDAVAQSKAHVTIGAADAIAKWLTIVGNDQPLLLLISALGLALAIKRRLVKAGPWLWICLFFLAAMALAAEFASLILSDSMRHHLAALLPFALFCAAGLHALTRYRKWLAPLALAWLLAGLAFQASASWWHFIALRSLVFTQPPTHILSRLALEASPRPAIIAYPYDQFYAPFALDHRGSKPVSQRQHYFTRHNIAMSAAGELVDFVGFVRRVSLESPVIWQVQPQSEAPTTAAGDALRALHYERCSDFIIGRDTLVEVYMRDLFDCEIKPPVVEANTEGISYRFYAAGLDDARESLRFIDQWQPVADPDLSVWRLSHQLIDADWQRVAGLDLPLAHPGKLRQFAIDIRGAPAGNYRLMVIMYRSDNGARASWRDNPNHPREMLNLTEIVIH